MIITTEKEIDYVVKMESDMNTHDDIDVAKSDSRQLHFAEVTGLSVADNKMAKPVGRKSKMARDHNARHVISLDQC